MINIIHVQPNWTFYQEFNSGYDLLHNQIFHSIHPFPWS
ncbi:hypothetical protein [Acinetobacter bereziniae]|nr:hypothetical protein [Acinetobacter bereziniae]